MNYVNQFNTTRKRLSQRWEATKALWKDPVQQRFEEKFLMPLERETHTTLKEMERLAQTIAKARRNVK